MALPSGNWERDTLEKLVFATVNERRSARRWGIFFKLSFLLLAFFALWSLYDFNFTGADTILGTADDNLGLGQFTDTTGYHRKDEQKAYGGRGGAPVWPNPYGVGQHLRDNPQYWREDVAFGAVDEQYDRAPSEARPRSTRRDRRWRRWSCGRTPRAPRPASRCA